jgi:gamma-D-glutamyl-L-lysine dipeptidyl-peptidase
MQYAFCAVPVAALRLLPDHKSEMVSQLLFGESVTVTDDSKKGWLKIITQYDAYEGWCQLAHVQAISTEAYSSNNNMLAADWVNKILLNDKPMHIPLGSFINIAMPGLQFEGNSFDPANAKYDAVTIKNLAFQFLNTAYVWGGRSVFGIDCSGFSQCVYKFLNIALLRDAQQQATQGELVNFLQEAQCGDLAFFDNEEGHIIHVGILLSSRQIIHAAGKVRIDNIDNQGIVNADTGERTQKLRIIKRYF